MSPPRTTKSAAKRALKHGAKVTEKPRQEKENPNHDKGLVTKEPMTDPKVVDILERQQKAQEQQGKEIERLTAVLTDMVGPVRLKVHRCMDKSRPEYLLIEYLDVVPVEVKRKLDS